MADLDIQKLKEGDENELRSLFNELHPRLYATALQFGLQQSDAEDAVQEAIVRIFKNLEKAPSVSSRQFLAWCRVVMRNTVIAYWRKDRSLDSQCRYYEQESQLEARTPESESLDARGVVATLLQELSDEDRTLIEQRLSGRTLSEIAVELKISRAAAYRRYSRAIKSLRERLATELAQK